MSISNPLQAAVAAHRFGLGEASFAAVGGDAAEWLAAQIGPADRALDGLLGTREAMQHAAAEREAKLAARNPLPGMTAEQVLAGHYREVVNADSRSRLLTAVRTTRPFAERLTIRNALMSAILTASTAALGSGAPSVLPLQRLTG